MLSMGYYVSVGALLIVVVMAYIENRPLAATGTDRWSEVYKAV